MNPWHGAPWTPRDWQREALPKVMSALDRRPIIRAVMGAGKSILLAEICAQFKGRIVVLTPTQALVQQLAATFRARGLKVGEYYADRKQPRKPVVVCCNDSLRSLSKKVPPPDLFIVDEAHKSECETVKDIILGERDMLSGERAEEAWTPKYRVGCTATPFRADEDESLSLFEYLVYNYGPTEAMRDGVIVPPREVHYHGTQTDTNLVCLELIRGAVRDGLGPGLVDSKSISDAHEFSEQLEQAGIRCKPVHSKLHKSTVDRRIGELDAGELDCLVHVSMLSEGVDLPWLRWLCCRRPISSPVLFCQYVGRGMRSLDPAKFPRHVELYGEKVFVKVFDPHLLFQTHGIDSYEAVLGASAHADPILPDLTIDFLVEKTRREGPGETMNGVPIRFITPAESYVSRLRLDWQCHGMLSMKLPDLQWRHEPMTGRQAGKIEQLGYVLGAAEIPNSHRQWLRLAWKMACKSTLTRGVASDLISILDVLRAYRWPGTSVEAA